MQPLPVGQPGLLLVRGPNVMKGYLGQPGEDRRSAARRLVHHGRHRGHGRGRLPHHHRPAEPLQQDRRRDGAAHQGRGETARTGGRDRAMFCRHRRARRKERRAARRAAHAAGSRNCRRLWPGWQRCDLPPLWRPRVDQFIRVEVLALPRHGQARSCAGFERSRSNRRISRSRRIGLIRCH